MTAKSEARAFAKRPYLLANLSDVQMDPTDVRGTLAECGEIADRFGLGMYALGYRDGRMTTSWWYVDGVWNEGHVAQVTIPKVPSVFFMSASGASVPVGGSDPTLTSLLTDIIAVRLTKEE